MGPSDADLIRQCLAGDNTGFDTLVTRYQGPVYSFCYRMLGDADEAADAAQESFIKAYNALESFRLDAAFLTWVLRIANNTCVDKSRRRAVRRADSLDEMTEGMGPLPSDEPSPEDVMMRSESERVVRDAVSRLPEKYRAGLVMFHFQNMPIKEIAQALGKPEGTVKSDLHIAREMLRRKLEGVVVQL